MHDTRVWHTWVQHTVARRPVVASHGQHTAYTAHGQMSTDSSAGSDQPLVGTTPECGRSAAPDGRIGLGDLQVAASREHPPASLDRTSVELRRRCRCQRVVAHSPEPWMRMRTGPSVQSNAAVAEDGIAPSGLTSLDVESSGIGANTVPQPNHTVRAVESRLAADHHLVQRNRDDDRWSN